MAHGTPVLQQWSLMQTPLCMCIACTSTSSRAASLSGVSVAATSCIYCACSAVRHRVYLMYCTACQKQPNCMPGTQILPVASVADLLLTVSKLWRLQLLLVRKLWRKYGLYQDRKGRAFGADSATALSSLTHVEPTTCGM